MTFLKKLGQIILQGAAIAAGIGPMAKVLIPGDNDDRIIDWVNDGLVQVASIITTVEAVGQVLNQPGPEKLRAASPLVAQIVLKSSVVAGRKIADPVKFQAGCQKIADGMADVLNSIDADEAKTT